MKNEMTNEGLNLLIKIQTRKDPYNEYYIYACEDLCVCGTLKPLVLKLE